MREAATATTALLCALQALRRLPPPAQPSYAPWDPLRLPWFLAPHQAGEEQMRLAGEDPTEEKRTAQELAQGADPADSSVQVGWQGGL